MSPRPPLRPKPAGNHDVIEHLSQASPISTQNQLHALVFALFVQSFAM